MYVNLCIGYLLDNMVWCGNATESDGIEKDLETCPGFHTSSQCSQTAATVFWSAASQNVGIRKYFFLKFYNYKELSKQGCILMSKA